VTFELVVGLNAGSVEAGGRLTPVHVLGAALSGIAVGTVAPEMSDEVDASRAIGTGRTVTFFYRVLAIVPGIAKNYIRKL